MGAYIRVNAAVHMCMHGTVMNACISVCIGAAFKLTVNSYAYQPRWLLILDMFSD